MAETGGDIGSTSTSTSTPPPQRRVPPITLPPRSSLDTSITGISPGPMTLVSNFFSDHYPDADIHSFSQLLAAVPPSPASHGTPASSVLYHDSSTNCQKYSEGYKQNRPPLGFFSTLQISEESVTTQTSDPEDSGIESLDNILVSQSGNWKPEPAVSLTKTVSDEYNWKKYGQKQVKASELPRSYYKCTQINCTVTKKIGHFLDGNISEIIYKGQHNHEPPLLRNRNRAKDGDTIDQHISFVEPADACQQVNYKMPNDVASDTENRKKRKLEVGCVDRASSSRVMVTETKIVVQTRSEVDILDDGFKWRKYGQKVMKGNTYPRSYYRCTYAECKVRKHVERDFLDLKSVVTTYEGKHKHEIPVGAKPSRHNETNFKTERPTLLELKEEQVAM